MASGTSAPGTRFPIPLVGVAVILVLLILLTPVLITGGGGAGSLLAQADLVVDHPGNTFTTNFYVRGVGVVRYALIEIGLNQDYLPNTPASQVHWTSWNNATSQISQYVSTNQLSVAVNVSVYYVPTSGSGVWYYGIVVSVYNFEQQTLTLTALTSGITVPSGPISTSIGHALPLVIALAYQGNSVTPP